jgi:heptosyltransferase-2
MTKLFILAPNWLGDAVMALPAIADLRSSGAAITVGARPAIAPLFSLVPDVDSIVPIEREDGTLRASLGERGFDAALLLPNSFHAALLASRAGIRERWGYRTQWRGRLLTRAVKRPSKVHQVEYYQHLVRSLGFDNGPGSPRVEAPARLRERGRDVLARAGWDGTSPLVALAPGAAYGGAKRWPAARFAELAAELTGIGAAIVMIGGAADRPAGIEIEERFARQGKILNLIGATDLPLLAGVLSHCRAAVSNDSGAMHFAAALGVPVTAIFGPTDERITGPGEGHVVLKHDVWCRPCHLRECPIDHRCMKGIPVSTVVAEARKTL